MKNRTAIPIPVLIKFPPSAARQDAWGRLTRLTAGGAELSTVARLLKDEWASLTFEIGQEAFDGVQDGYSKGRFGYLDLIEARRNLIEARVQLLTASAAYHEAAAEIAGLTAPLPGEGSSK